MNRIKSLIFSLLKYNNLFINFMRYDDKIINVVMNGIYIETIIAHLKKIEYGKIYQILSSSINVEEYKKNYLPTKDIIIYNITNPNKLCDYLHENGVIWNGGSVLRDKFSYFKERNIYLLLRVHGKLMYGSFFEKNDNADRIILEEKDFYEYYEKVKKIANNNIINCLIKNENKTYEFRFVRK